MMDKNKFEEELLKNVTEINNKLSFLVKLQTRSTKKPSVGAEEKQVLKFCDKKHTAEEIATALDKDVNNIRVTVHNLKEKGVISPIRVNKRPVYEKVNW